MVRKVRENTVCADVHPLEKTAKQTTDIILYDQKVIVFKMESDVMLYVVGGEISCVGRLDLLLNNFKHRPRRE